MESKTIEILLVDDEEQFRKGTTRVLERRGFAVQTAADGREALERLATIRPDVVLLDLRMEGMGGIETLEEIRKKHADLPVIILTGHGGFEDAVTSIRLEITDFIQKPVDVEALADKIRHAVSARRREPLREKTVAELMVPVQSYEKVYIDQSVTDALRVLKKTFFSPVVGKVTEVGHRSVLVMDRNEKLVGLIRMMDVLEMIEPEALADSPYSSYFTGMFLAQCKVFGQGKVGDYVDRDDLVTITERTPLMEALMVMAQEKMINLPVMRGDQVVGILRDRDLFLEITNNVLGE